MARGLSFSGPFACEARRNLAPGSRYIGVTCQGCGKHFALMDDISGDGDIAFGGDARIATECPDCATKADYTPADLLSFKAATGMATSIS